MIKVIYKIFLNAVPVILMIGLIPFIQNDSLLTLVYIIVIVASFLVKYEKRDYLFLLFGLVVITISELFFVNTGAEVFTRASLFGSIPLWLPFLWSYSFVAIKRSIIIIDNHFKP